MKRAAPAWPAVRAPWAVTLLLATMLAGCAQGGGSGHASAVAPQLDFAPMSLQTVPLEPAEGRGVLTLAWDAGRMAVSAHNEGGMPPQAVRDGATLYTTQAGMGWTRWDAQAYADSSPRGFRYLVWDVPALLHGASVKVESATRFTATASVTVQGRASAVDVAVNHTGPAIVDVQVRTALDPESPYTLRPLGHALPFAAAPPAVSRPSDEVARLDAAARDGHAHILGWITSYRDQTGRLPQDVSADGLVVQRLGQPWPTDPYDGQPMANKVASGDFQWLRCSDADGSFHGFGWDGAPLNQDFGKGCKAPA